MSVDDTPDTTISTTNIDISHVTVRSTSNRRISIPITVETSDHTEKIHALIDCGAEGLFIDKSIANKWRKQKIKPIRVQNVDGTLNSEGEIKERCSITFDMNGKRMTEWFSVTALGIQKIILGLPWLEKHNPDVNWRDKTLEFRDSEKDKEMASLRSICHDIDRIAMPIWDEDLVIRYLSSHKGPGMMDHRWETHTFDDNRSWSEDEYDHVTIARYTPAQKMEHKYRQIEEVSNIRKTAKSLMMSDNV